MNNDPDYLKALTDLQIEFPGADYDLSLLSYQRKKESKKEL